MTSEQPLRDVFDTWVSTNAPATTETFFLFHSWIERMDLAILAHRPDGEIVYLNAATADLVGVRRRDLVGEDLTTLFGKDWFADHSGQVRETSPENCGFVGSLSVNGDALQRQFEIVSTVVFTTTGEPGIVWLLLGDITRLVTSQFTLHETNERLRESNRDLEDFAYVASHDLQEPLRKIIAFGGRLRGRIEDDVDQKSLDYLDRMDGASRRMQTLINDLLSFSRVTTKGRPLVPVDLREVVDHVLHDLEVAIGESGAMVNVGVLPTIDGDALLLGQLFQNLIGNALKFNHKDRPSKIWVEAVMIGGRWLLSVRDNGIGFDQEYAEKIFTVFQRLHGRSEYEGTGVGLAICRKIIERHGGTIRAKSDGHQGAAFLIDLPRSIGELAIAA